MAKKINKVRVNAQHPNNGKRQVGIFYRILRLIFFADGTVSTKNDTDYKELK